MNIQEKLALLDTLPSVTDAKDTEFKEYLRSRLILEGVDSSFDFSSPFFNTFKEELADLRLSIDSIRVEHQAALTAKTNDLLTAVFYEEPVEGIDPLLVKAAGVLFNPSTARPGENDHYELTALINSPVMLVCTAVFGITQLYMMSDAVGNPKLARLINRLFPKADINQHIGNMIKFVSKQWLVMTNANAVECYGPDATFESVMSDLEEDEYGHVGKLMSSIALVKQLAA